MQQLKNKYLNAFVKFWQLTNMADVKKCACVLKQPVDFHINEQTTLETEKPLDFSFKKLKKLTDAKSISK